VHSRRERTFDVPTAATTGLTCVRTQKIDIEVILGIHFDDSMLLQFNNAITLFLVESDSDSCCVFGSKSRRDEDSRLRNFPDVDSTVAVSYDRCMTLDPGESDGFDRARFRLVSELGLREAKTLSCEALNTSWSRWIPWNPLNACTRRWLTLL
jgi:hypothetical protein